MYPQFGSNFTLDPDIICNSYLQFIIKWNGLHVKYVRRQPKKYNEYKTRAVNWLNGRRAPNYDRSLYPDILEMTQEVYILYL